MRFFAGVFLVFLGALGHDIASRPAKLAECRPGVLADKYFEAKRIICDEADERVRVRAAIGRMVETGASHEEIEAFMQDLASSRR